WTLRSALPGPAPAWGSARSAVSRRPAPAPTSAGAPQLRRPPGQVGVRRVRRAQPRKRSGRPRSRLSTCPGLRRRRAGPRPRPAALSGRRSPRRVRRCRRRPAPAPCPWGSTPSPPSPARVAPTLPARTHPGEWLTAGGPVSSPSWNRTGAGPCLSSPGGHAVTPVANRLFGRLLLLEFLDPVVEHAHELGTVGVRGFVGTQLADLVDGELAEPGPDRRQGQRVVVGERGFCGGLLCVRGGLGLLLGRGCGLLRRLLLGGRRLSVGRLRGRRLRFGRGLRRLLLLLLLLCQRLFGSLLGCCRSFGSFRRLQRLDRLRRLGGTLLVGGDRLRGELRRGVRVRGLRRNRFADRALGPLRWDVSGGHVLGLAGHHGTGRPTEQTLERVTDSVDQGGLRHGTRRLLSGHGHNGVSTSDGVAGTRRDGDDVLYCADSQNRGVLRITAGERNGIHQFGTDTGPKRRLRPFACPKARASGYGP